MSENFEPRFLFGNQFEMAIKRMVLADHDALLTVLSDPNQTYDTTWLTGMFNTNTGQEINRTLQLYIPPVRIHDEWSRETMSEADRSLVTAIIDNLPDENRNFFIYSYGELPYRDPISLRDYLDKHRSYEDLFDAVVESIKLIKTDYRGYARHSGIDIRDIAIILYDIQLALKQANENHAFDYVDQLEDYDYNDTSVMGPSF